MKLLVNALGAWIAVRAAEGHYPRPVAIGLGMLVSRLGPSATMLALAGYGLKRLDEAGAFDDLKRTWRSDRSLARRPADSRPRLSDRDDSDADMAEEAPGQRAQGSR